MPVQGILSSPAAWSQAKFDQLRREVDQGTKRKVESLATISTNPAIDIKPKTESGPAVAPHAYTPQSLQNLEREFAAHGYPATKIADAFFPFTYSGHMLNPAFHVLDPAFGGQKADFHV